MLDPVRRHRVCIVDAGLACSGLRRLASAGARDRGEPRGHDAASEQPIVVTIRRSDDGGCQVALALVDGSIWTLAMLALLARSQRRRTNLTKA